MVDEPGNGAYYGSIVAAPYGKIVFENLFDYLGEEKQDPNVKVEYVKMPNLIGLSLAQAVVLLKENDLFYEIDGEGEYVIDQLPPPQTDIAKGSTIVLIT